MPLSTWLVAGLIFLAVALGTVAIALLFEFIQERLRARTVVKQLHEFSEQAYSAETGSLVRQQAEGSWVEREFARVPKLRDVGRTLREAGSSWNFQTFVVVSIGIGMAFGLALGAFSRSIFGVIFGFPIGAAIPYIIIRMQAARRKAKLEEQLPDAIDLMGRAMRAGHPLSAGFKMVADEAPEPIASEFRQVFEEQRFGLPFDDSLLSLGDRVRLSDIRILITAILIHRQVGGNLAEVLDNIAALVRERFKLRRQLRVITAQGRMSGYVLALLPFVLGVVIFTLNREYMMPIFEDEMGRFMLVGAFIFQVLGYLWIRKILDIEF